VFELLSDDPMTRCTDHPIADAAKILAGKSQPVQSSKAGGGAVACCLLPMAFFVPFVAERFAMREFANIN